MSHKPDYIGIHTREFINTSQGSASGSGDSFGEGEGDVVTDENFESGNIACMCSGHGWGEGAGTGTCEGGNWMAPMADWEEGLNA